MKCIRPISRTKANLANILELKILELISHCVSYFSVADKAPWPIIL